MLVRQLKVLSVLVWVVRKWDQQQTEQKTISPVRSGVWAEEAGAGPG